MNVSGILSIIFVLVPMTIIGFLLLGYVASLL